MGLVYISKVLATKDEYWGDCEEFGEEDFGEVVKGDCEEFGEEDFGEVGEEDLADSI